MRAYLAGRTAVITVTAFQLSSALVASAIAAPGSVLEQCWAAAALAGKPGENGAHRDRHFDAPPPEAPLASFSPLPAAETGVIRRVTLATDRKLIALTFDLCEQPGELAGYDGAIVDYLRKEGVKATFFAGGKWLRSHEERARQLMVDPLFEIGNHSEAHRSLRRLEGVRMTNEIVAPQRSYEAIRARLAQMQCVREEPGAESRIAPRMTLFRFPYGACNARALQAVHDQGLRAIQWDVSTGDSSPAQSANAIARTMLTQARPGSIILSHANGRGRHTAAALPLAVPKLRQMGFEFVTVSELLDAGKPVISQSCYDNRPGDTDRYDVLAARRRIPATKTIFDPPKTIFDP